MCANLDKLAHDNHRRDVGRVLSKVRVALLREEGFSAPMGRASSALLPTRRVPTVSKGLIFSEL